MTRIHTDAGASNVLDDLKNPLDKPKHEHQNENDKRSTDPLDRPGFGDNPITDPLDKPAAADKFIKNPLDKR